VNQELAHVNVHTPLHIFEDFVEYISKDDTPILEVAKNDSKGLVSQMDGNLNCYSEAVKEEQTNIKKILNEFNDVFQDKSEELVSLLESQLSAHNEKFQERYQKLENELLTDDLANAQLLKFKEISTELSKTRGSEKQCDFLKQVLKKRQAWEEASVELKQYPQKTYEFYENIVTQQMDIEPKLQNKDQLIDTWNKGLSSLIQKVLNQAQIGDQNLNENQYIWLNLETISDLELLCDEMLRPETLLCYKPKAEEKLKADDLAECLGRLTGLRALALDFSLLGITTDDLQKSLATITDLKELKCLELNLAGVGLSAQAFPDLVKNIKGCKGLTELSLNLSHNNISSFGDLIERLSEIKHLNELNLNLSGNKTDAASIEALVLTLRVLKHLESLSINLSGYSQCGAGIDKKSCYKLVNCFAELDALKKFSLDLGHGNLSDDHFIDLAYALKKIPSLRHLDLVINNNKLEERGAKKIAKALAKSHVISLSLNVHSNDLGDQGVEELLGFLQENRKWVKVVINLRNVGLNKSQANTLHHQYAQDNVKIIF